MSGAELARAAAADFESFFFPAAGMRVNVSVEAINHACIRTNSRGSSIVIPREMAAEPIDDPDRLHFHLLILSHEIAHLVHRHTHAGQQQNKDYRSLEYWADFYGAKVMMALLTYGRRVGPIFRQFFPGEHFFEDTLESIGRAVGRLVETVYTDDPRYPPPLLRVGLASNGVTSFFRFHLNNPDPIWPFSVFKRIFSSPAVKELMLFRPEDVEYDEDPVRRALAWHREMQGTCRAIALGMKPPFLPFLHTTFDQTEEEIAFSRKIRRDELRKAGFDV